ncbi:3',5'-nucleoside bisphosphate phosphatase [Massilia sp. TS11]|uniref:3',5'-nucleoside bisphosphate phosphatase n=1 Tax=Massilia sp. TS11 TaxID=2908003 RepID=UPI001EDC826B|nr:3',5'-nucleoside bisphosphate phosphatase [Massilia sp. TS11]MCG2582959.1 PHP domain-containing protein [Massilia sp. TS11]
MLKADLHCHSTISDGLLAPAQVAALAHAAGVELWALTDHDEVDGVAAARAAARRLGMGFVAGVEISVTWANHTVHIVGLQIDETDTALCNGLIKTRSGRDQRGREIGAQLAAAGIPGAYEGALKYVANPALLSRTHFARFLIEAGVATSVAEVFKRYLAEGKPGYVPHRWATLAEALGWIRAAGGVAVLAHPGRYPLDPVAEAALFDEFISLGGRAVEVVTGSHTPDQYATYAALARRYGLLASRGADFHGPGESRVDFAGLPPLPADLVPVWHDW